MALKKGDGWSVEREKREEEEYSLSSLQANGLRASLFLRLQVSHATGPTANGKSPVVDSSSARVYADRHDTGRPAGVAFASHRRPQRK